jgi:hypothetical protein
MLAHATVVLEIFSGRPDPSWPLDTQRTAELSRRLESLPAARESALPEGAPLGYRGLHVSFTEGTEGRIVEVRRGFVADRRRILEDRGRTVERWLLGTAPPELSELIRSAAERLR